MESVLTVYPIMWLKRPYSEALMPRMNQTQTKKSPTSVTFATRISTATPVFKPPLESRGVTVRAASWLIMLLLFAGALTQSAKQAGRNPYFVKHHD